MNKENNHYTSEDKKCFHCGGEIQAHCVGKKIIYWCEKCGSNNKKYPPNVKIEVK